MNIWENAVLTDKGTALQAKLVDGQTLHITKVVSGGAKVPVVNLRQQTNVTDGGKEITLQPVRIEGDKTILPVLLENIGLEEGYDLWQVGIYAQDPEEGEILYCLAQASEAKHIPSATEGPGFSITWDFVIKTSNTAPFEVDVNSVGLVSIEQYQVHAGEIHSLKSANVNLDGRIEDLNADIDNATKAISKCDLICTIEKLTNNVVKEFQANWQDYYFISICYGNYGNIFNSILIPSYYLETTAESTRIVVNSNADNACSIYKKNASTLYARTGNWVDSNGRIRVYGIMKK